jgi:hypothetical protein
MIKVIKLTILAIILMLTATGCGSTKIVNVPPQNVVKQMSLKSMHDAIYRAGVSRGWTMADVSPGVLHATYARRGFTVTIAVTFSSTAYSINYVSSQGLNYDPDSETIHRNYNSWIQNLKKQINMEISLSSGNSVAAPAATPAATKETKAEVAAPADTSSDEW